MGIPVTFNGLSVVVPETNDQGWGGDVTALLVQLANFAATNSAFVQATRIAFVSPITILTTDFAVGIAMAGPAVVNLPPGLGNTGKIFVIYDYLGNGRLFPKTILPNGLDLINGRTSYSLSQNFGSVFVTWNGVAWALIAGFDAPISKPFVYNQPFTNTSAVVSATIPSLPLPSVPNLQTATLTFQGQATYMFTVSIADRAFICNASFSSPAISAVSDPTDLFLPANSGTGIAVTKAASSAIITITNRLGSLQTIEIKSLTADINSTTTWS